MGDGAKIAAGLALFLGVALAPVWQRAVAGAAARPAPRLATPGRPCVADRAAMRASHMQLLRDWREAVVRIGAREGPAPAGGVVTRSLTGTCLACHGDRQQFCDACHQDVGVSPPCFDCHLERGARP